MDHFCENPINQAPPLHAEPSAEHTRTPYVSSRQNSHKAVKAADCRPRKRRRASEQMSDPDSKQSESSTAEASRPKKARETGRRLHNDRNSTEIEPTGDTSAKVPKKQDTAAPKSPSPKATSAQQKHTSPKPPNSAFRDLPDIVAQPPGPQKPATPLPDNPSKAVVDTPSTPIQYAMPAPYRSHPQASFLTGSNSYPLETPSRSTLDTTGYGTGQPNPTGPQRRRKTVSRYNPNPPTPAAVGQLRNQAPVVEQQNQAAVPQFSMAQLYRASQLHQQAELATAHRVMLQKAIDNDYARQFFIHRGATYTLRECLLACSLKIFCKFEGNQPGGEFGDDTVAEILQHQREWSEPNGLDCRGLVAALIHERSSLRTKINDCIGADRQKWSNYAWGCYRSWLESMNQIFVRVYGRPFSTFLDGQFLGSGFQGNVNDLLGQRYAEQPVATPTGYIRDGIYLPDVGAMGRLITPKNGGEEVADEAGTGRVLSGPSQWFTTDFAGTQSNVFTENEAAQAESITKDKYLPRMEGAMEGDSFGLEES